MVGEVLKCQKQKSILKMRVRVPKIFKTEINTENECVWGGGGRFPKILKTEIYTENGRRIPKIPKTEIYTEMGGVSLKSSKQKSEAELMKI